MPAPVGSCREAFLLHVIPGTLPAELRRRAEVKAHDDLKKAAASATLAASVAGHSDLVVEIEVSVGKPFAEIIRRARQMGAELTVVGRHGQGPCVISSSGPPQCG